MLYILTNIILFILRLLPLGIIIDNRMSVYSILITSFFILVIISEKYLKLLTIVTKGNSYTVALLVIGLVLNSTASFFLWLIGLVLMLIAYVFALKQYKASQKRGEIKAKTKPKITFQNMKKKFVAWLDEE